MLMHTNDRLHALDAVRAFALTLGILFHAGFSFLPGMPPGLWAMVDSSPSTTVAVVLFTAHIFRMSLFFFMAGFFGRMMFDRKGASGFWRDRLKRILVPLVVGWMLLFPAIAAVWVWGLTKTFGGDLPAGGAMPPPPPGWFPLTHLWFLYYLLIIYVLAVSGRAAIVAFDRQSRLRRGIDAVVHRLVSSGSAALVLGLPLAAALYSHENWIAWFGIPTPDQSLIPQLVSIVGYGTAFTFGWQVHRQPALLQVWGHQWRAHLAAALVLTAVCMALAGATPTLTPAVAGLRTLSYALAYVVAIWCWVFAVTGVAVRFLAAESGVRRYIADASYWMYLVHLPIVAALQVVVGRWPLHWSIKLPLVVGVTFAILLASYHLLVRFTFVGVLLNGRRHVRQHYGPATMPERASADAVHLARLAAVYKRYGKIVALDGVDLHVNAGELVALLGQNGAGKSTTVALMLGLIEPDSGDVRLMGEAPTEVAPRRSIGVMMQEVALQPALRVREHIALAAAYYPNPLTVAEAMAITGTTELAGRRYGTLSAGQKRQVQFAVAICGRPQLLFLDEPSVGLDVQARERMWQTLRELVAGGTAVVLTTHYLEEAEALASRVVVINHGRVVTSGSVDEVRAVVGRKRIVCTSSLQTDEVRGWPGVVDVQSDARRMLITAADAEGVVRRLLAGDPVLANLEVRPAGLAEAFAELTSKAA
jgi:ABC-type multidrug transport system ATPase subunit/peptidoglycan/LPS O-acetylase OafA/YrhL